MEYFGVPTLLHWSFEIQKSRIFLISFLGVLFKVLIKESLGGGGDCLSLGTFDE